MKLSEMGVTAWVGVGVILVIVAALGVTFLSERSPIRADNPAPTATATPETFPTPLPDPPCYEEFERKYGDYSFLMIGTGKTNCVLYGPDYNIISEAEAFILIAEWERKKAQAAQSAAATQKTVDPELLARSITLSDGSVVHLPDDVQIVEIDRYDIIECIVGRYCPKQPLYKLKRGDSVIVMDYHGVGHWSPDAIDPDDFSFIPRILDRLD